MIATCVMWLRLIHPTSDHSMLCSNINVCTDVAGLLHPKRISDIQFDYHKIKQAGPHMALGSCHREINTGRWKRYLHHTDRSYGVKQQCLPGCGKALPIMVFLDDTPLQLAFNACASIEALQRVVRRTEVMWKSSSHPCNLGQQEFFDCCASHHSDAPITVQKCLKIWLVPD